MSTTIAPSRPAAVRAIALKDFTAVRRSKGVMLPMLIVPFLLLVVLPLIVGLAARNAHPPDVSNMLRTLPGGLAKPLLNLPPRERLVTLVDGYLLAPLFLIVPLMLAAVLAADAFAGEKERKTLEILLHQPVPDRDLFIAKLLSAFIPAVAISWIGFACFTLGIGVVVWGVALWLVARGAQRFTRDRMARTI